jgi:hypothetical protein
MIKESQHLINEFFGKYPDLCDQLKTNVLKWGWGRGRIKRYFKDYDIDLTDRASRELVDLIWSRGIPNGLHGNESISKNINISEPKKQNEWKKQFEQLKLTPQEAKHLVELCRSGKNNSHGRLDIPGDLSELKFLVFSDSHIGHKEFRDDVFKYMVDKANEENVKFGLNAGDTIEGMSGRDGHIYELSHVGYSAQKEEFKRLFDMFNFPVYSIESTASHSGWFGSKHNAGVDVGKELAECCDNYKFLGYDEADILFNNGQFKVRLSHPGGGSAYSVSYKPQKYVEAISGGKKPHLFIQGHYHKMLYFDYRNVDILLSGSIMNQSIFMRKHNLHAAIGFWIVEVKFDKTGWAYEMTPKRYKFHE